MNRVERNCLAEVLKLYKNNPILWNKKDPYYKKPELRNEAYHILLEKYNTVYVGRGMKNLKKKIDCMRTSWLREKKKVEESRRRGDNPVYTPTLWFYKMLDFLDPNFEDSVAEYTDSENTFDNEVEYLEPLESDDDEYEPEEKKPNIEHTFEIEPRLLPKYRQNRKSDDYDPLDGPVSNEARGRAESEAFGKIVGLQLLELDRYQRSVAQKLISDVIFYARLNKLSDKSFLSI
ncbi:uncharacterized protein LOC121731665 [Aricia agestis]|uniref:uncharacterized protein LOC121731665 n=1 Tax=Aricia agestis TaxID=91739 RepID=UPI001C20580B|nr:uncharacterized protein LOC121731665 [Aricia agestis]